MIRDCIHFLRQIFSLLRCCKSVSLGLSLAVSASLGLWAQSAPMHSVSNESEVAQAYRLGMGLVKDGRVDEAITTFANGLKTDPQNAVLLNVIGAAYSLKGEFEQAERYLLMSLKADPRLVPARKNLAINYFNLGKYDLATTEFQELIKENGESRSVALLFLAGCGKTRFEADAVP